MKNFFSKTGWFLLMLVPPIVSFAVQIFMGMIMGMVLSITALSQGMNYAETMTYIAEATISLAPILVLGYHVLSLPLFGLWYYFGCKKPKITNPLKHLGGIRVPVVLLLSFGLCLFANAFVFLGYYLFPNAIAAYIELMEAAGMGINVYTIIASVLLAPIGEELVCRGIVWYYGKRLVAGMQNRTVAFWIVNCIQAIGFGFMHGNLIQGTYAFFIGLGLGWLREHYNSIYPAMLAHACINFMSTFLMDSLIGWIPDHIVAAILLTIVSLTVTFGAVILENKKGKTKS